MRRQGWLSITTLCVISFVGNTAEASRIVSPLTLANPGDGTLWVSSASDMPADGDVFQIEWPEQCGANLQPNEIVSCEGQLRMWDMNTTFTPPRELMEGPLPVQVYRDHSGWLRANWEAPVSDRLVAGEATEFNDFQTLRISPTTQERLVWASFGVAITEAEFRHRMIIVPEPSTGAWLTTLVVACYCAAARRLANQSRASSHPVGPN